jgi:hypothetical protein
MDFIASYSSWNTRENPPCPVRLRLTQSRTQRSKHALTYCRSIKGKTKQQGFGRKKYGPTKNKLALLYLFPNPA